MPEPGARTTRPHTRVIAVHTRTAVTRGRCASSEKTTASAASAKKHPRLNEADVGPVVFRTET